MSSTNIETLAETIQTARHIVAFTGAGMSTDSGIPDFRSPGGKWTQVKPVMFQDFISDHESRYEYWRQKSEGFEEFGTAEPNAGHRMLATWEKERGLSGIVTQNIDGLHQDAGSKSVIEIHGTAREVQCLRCGFRDRADDYCKYFLRERKVPACPACNAGLLKHATISFGQPLEASVLKAATALVRTADLMLVMGTSLVVEPAASLPVTAKQYGAKLAIVNRDATQHDSFADLVIRDNIVKTLTAIEAMLS